MGAASTFQLLPEPDNLPREMTFTSLFDVINAHKICRDLGKT